MKIFEIKQISAAKILNIKYGITFEALKIIISKIYKLLTFHLLIVYKVQ
jgi:hypothetical protein